MDSRLALLLHCPLGLSLTASELETLTRVPAIDLNLRSVEDFVLNPKGRQYLREHRDWFLVAEKILETSQKNEIHWTYPYQPDYPQAWLELSLRPAIVSYRGVPLWKNQTPLISIVGSRTPKPETILWMQRELSLYFEQCEIHPVSGGARGVDQWVHRLSLDSRRPTVCIFPSGLLNPYPFGCEGLWRRILDQGGVVVSTFALNQPLHKGLFPVRNRWISGLSRTTFVVEGNRRSGSMLTAKMAMDESRTLCTLPVFPLSEQGLGNLDLLEQGALMIRDHRDLITLHERELRPALTNGT